MTQRTRTLLKAALGLSFLIALGIYAYYGVHVKSKKDMRARLEARLILKLDKDEVTALEVDKSGKQTRVERIGADEMNLPTWKMTEPVETDGDNISINSLLGTVERLESERVLDDIQGVDLKTYGLRPPRGKLSLSTGREETLDVLIGKKSSFDNLLYVQVEGDTAVYLVKGYLEAELLKGTYSLRRKELAPIGRERVTRLVLRRGGQTIDLEKDPQGWKMISPLSGQADEEEVSRLLSGLAGLRARSFRDRTKVALSHYGLAPPDLELTVHVGKDQALRRIGLGKGDLRPGREVYYARSIEPAGPVAEIDEDGFRVFEKKPFDLRAKRLMKFEKDAVFKIKSAGEQQLLVLEKTRESWSLVSPRAAPVDESVVADLLQALADLKANQFLGEKESVDLTGLGLDRPERTITLYDREGQPLSTLCIGRTTGSQTVVSSSTRSQLCRVAQAGIGKILNEFQGVTQKARPNEPPKKP